MIKVELVKNHGCAHCTQTLETLNKIKPDYPDMKIEEILMTTEEGRKLVQKYMIMSSPGVIINDELAFTGGASESQLRKKLNEYQDGNPSS